MVVVAVVVEIVVVEVVEVAEVVVVVSAGFSFGSLDRLQWRRSSVPWEAVVGCCSLFHSFSLSDFNLWNTKQKHGKRENYTAEVVRGNGLPLSSR